MKELITINQLAKLSGITVRTLHYYDEVNLLKPASIGENGYRQYSQKDIMRLQEIMTLKELGFSLKDIKTLIDTDALSRQDAFAMQRDILVRKRQRLTGIINSLNKLMEDNEMSFNQFDMTGIEDAKNKYKDEAEKRWGHTDAYKESARKTNKYTKADWAAIESEATAIYDKFIANLKSGIPTEDNADIVRQWQEHITKNYYKCTGEILSGLGQMYVADERFTKNIDKRCQGLAEYMAESIKKYCE